jgi:uncharacterized protein GlcG (DUF336 family)
MKIPYSLACLLASIAEEQAAAIEVPMTIAVVDEEGGLLFFGRMDGALPVSSELAVSKAFTAAVSRMSTHELGKLAQPGEPLYGIQQTHQGRIVLFGGGLPLRLQGRVSGAVGVSGGTVEQDIQVARAAVEAFEEMEKWAGYMSGAAPFHPSLDIPSLHGLEKLLSLELQKMGCSFPGGNVSVLTGAVLLAVSSASRSSI